MQVTIRDRQTLLDIAIQHCGSVEAAFDLSLSNNLSLTDNLETGCKMKSGQVVSKGVVAAFATDKNIPISAGTEPVVEGVGFWHIGLDFKIS